MFFMRFFLTDNCNLLINTTIKNIKSIVKVSIGYKYKNTSLFPRYYYLIINNIEFIKKNITVPNSPFKIRLNLKDMCKSYCLILA